MTRTSSPFEEEPMDGPPHPSVLVAKDLEAVALHVGYFDVAGFADGNPELFETFFQQSAAKHGLDIGLPPVERV